eukprot:3927627-Rhodomonas_salina.1
MRCLELWHVHKVPGVDFCVRSEQDARIALEKVTSISLKKDVLTLHLDIETQLTPTASADPQAARDSATSHTPQITPLRFAFPLCLRKLIRD